MPLAMSGYSNYAKEFTESLIEQLYVSGKKYSANEIEKLFLGQRQEEELQKRLKPKSFLGRLKEKITFTYNEYEEFWKLPTEVRKDVFHLIELNIKKYNPDYSGGIKDLTKESFGEKYGTEYITPKNNIINPPGIIDFCNSILYFKPDLNTKLNQLT